MKVDLQTVTIHHGDMTIKIDPNDQFQISFFFDDQESLIMTKEDLEKVIFRETYMKTEPSATMKEGVIKCKKLV